MEYSQVVELEEKLLELLRQEYSFYQSFYLLVDKQKDHLKFERDQKLISALSLPGSAVRQSRGRIHRRQLIPWL